MDYSKLSDIEIDTMVSKIRSPEFHRNYCNNPADAWPILLESKISLNYMVAEEAWCAHVDGLMTDGCWCWDIDPEHYHDDKNPLRAGMIAFLMMKDSAL